MKKLTIGLMLFAVAGLSNACIASRKFVRNEVTTSSTALDTKLSARIDENQTTTENNFKELRDTVKKTDDKLTGEIGKVDTRVSETGKRVDGLKGDVDTVAQKTTAAQSSADRAANDVGVLDQKFQNRNDYIGSVENAVYFNFNSAQLDDTAKMVLDQVAAALLQNANALLVLEGRTDSVGDDKYNVRLGEQRVESVRRYLVVDKSVPIFKLHDISFGAAKPVADNHSKEGRQKNRAVTMTVLVPKADPATASR